MARTDPLNTSTRVESAFASTPNSVPRSFTSAAGVWTTNVSTAQQMIRDVVSGQVFVNTYGASGGVELPFGGFRQSGYGREKGAEGLRGFAQIKTAVIAS